MFIQIFQKNLCQLLQRWLQKLRKGVLSLSVSNKYMFDPLFAFSHQSSSASLQSLEGFKIPRNP